MIFTNRFLFLFCICLAFTFCSPSRKAKQNRLPVAIAPPERSSVKLEPHRISLQKAAPFDLTIPEGYEISVAYQGLGRLRFLTKSPDGRLFATDMHDLTDNKKSKIYIFEGWDETTHRFATIRTFMQNLRNVNQVSFYHTDGKDYIYIPETGKLTRYIYHAGDNAPSGKPELIATFPAYGLSYKYGGWHLTRSLAFHNGKLYISVGSSCNNCIEKENIRATIMEMDPDGQNRNIYATGLRNSVGIKWVNDELWVSGMGQDKLGNDKPEDIFTTVKQDQYYGWPFFYQYKGKICPDEEFQLFAKQNGYKVPDNPSKAIWGFDAHSAPLGFEHFKNFSDPSLNNGFLVALHGSTDLTLQRGNAIVRIDPEGKYSTFISGFLQSPNLKRNGRPCDIMMNDDHSFYFTDDMRGVLYYVWKRIN